MGNNKYSKSFEISLSGVSCAVASACLALGLISGWLVATGYLAGILALMVPLSKQFFKGGFLAYLGTCILAIALGAAVRFWDLVPFIMFFGLHPLLNALQIRFKINKWLALAVKAVWFDCTLIAAYFLIFGGVLGGSFLPAEAYDVVNKYVYVFIFTVGTVLFALYDYIIFKCQIVINQIVCKIKK